MFTYRTNRPPFRVTKNSRATSPQGKSEASVEGLGNPRAEDYRSNGQIKSNGEILLTFPAVSTRLGVKKTTIWKLIWEERLEKIKLGRRSLITESSVDRLIAELVAEARLKREVGL